MLQQMSTPLKTDGLPLMLMMQRVKRSFRYRNFTGLHCMHWHSCYPSCLEIEADDGVIGHPTDNGTSISFNEEETAAGVHAVCTVPGPFPT